MQVVAGVASASAMLRDGFRPEVIVRALMDHVGLTRDEALQAVDFAQKAEALGWPIP